ncbi:MAG: hypothetical protein AAF282_08695 [Cyanobacteria bacterium P01_A01_bin.15]
MGSHRQVLTHLADGAKLLGSSKRAALAALGHFRPSFGVSSSRLIVEQQAFDLAHKLSFILAINSDDGTKQKGCSFLMERATRL